MVSEFMGTDITPATRDRRGQPLRQASRFGHELGHGTRFRIGHSHVSSRSANKSRRSSEIQTGRVYPAIQEIALDA